jgi:hypothetical protein
MTRHEDFNLKTERAPLRRCFLFIGHTGSTRSALDTPLSAAPPPLKLIPPNRTAPDKLALFRTGYNRTYSPEVYTSLRTLMATPRLTHFQREQAVLNDLQAHFPRFTGLPLSWTNIPEGMDPPDFVGNGSGARVGLELVEWLDGNQMTEAKKREAVRNQIVRLLDQNWENEYRPHNFRAAFIEPRGERIAASDADGLQREFFAPLP